jgi:tetratricopeptide (TPR) repeat protein
MREHKAKRKSEPAVEVRITVSAEAFMKRFIAVLGTGILVFALPARSQQSSSASAITETSVGPVRLGMTVAQVRSALPGLTLTRATDGEGTPMIFVKRGATLLMTLYAGETSPGTTIDERAVIEFVEARDSSYRTAAGVYPRMSLPEVERKYGKLHEITLSEIEAREHATFANHPAGISFRVRTDSVLAGIYPANQARTERYSPTAYVSGISISARRKPRQAFSSAYTDLKTQCENPAPANNEAQHSSLFCKGYGNYRIHIFDSAEALNIYVQSLDGQVSIPLATQSLTWDQQGRKVEWRLADGKPFAVIVRVFKYSGKGQYPFQEKPTGEVLLVKGLPGYEHIDAEVDIRSTPNGNEKARQLADGDYDKATVFVRRAFASYAMKDYDKVIAEATQAIAANPQHATAYHLRAVAYSLTNARDSAFADLNQAIKLNPSFALAYANRGSFHRRALIDARGGDSSGVIAARAIADLSEAVRLDPEIPGAYYNRGLVYLGRDPDRAIADFNKVIALKWNDTLAYIGRGEAYADKKEYDLAIADFSKVLSLSPKNVHTYEQRAKAYCAAGRKDLAAADEKRLAELGMKLFDDQLCGAATASQPPPDQASVEKPLPRFEDYPALDKFSGHPANPILTTSRARLYRTSIRDDVKAGPNFAGRYTIASWGCSSTCVGFAVVDARTGRVVFHPKVLQITQVPYQTENVMQFRPDSRLLIIAGEILPLDPDEATAPDGIGKFYYEWTGNRFTLIRTASIQRERGAP